MLVRAPIKQILAGTALIVAPMFFGGCITDNKIAAVAPASNEAVTLAQEMDHMAASQGSVASAILKIAAADTDSATFTVTPPTYDSTCKCFIRTQTYSAEDFQRLRVDSITFRDSAGNALRWRNFAKLRSVSHVRHITQQRGSHTFLMVLSTTMLVSIGVDTTGTWNGTVSGSYDGEELKSGTITNVVRTFHNHHWGYALSGQVIIDRPSFSISISFEGGGKAQSTRTNKKTGKVTVVTIDRNYKETP